MANQNYFYERNTQHGSILYSGVSAVYNGRISCETALGHMTAMIGTDDPAQETSFTEVATRYGFGSNADAKGAYDELNSLLANLTTIEAVIKQAHDRLT